MTTESKPTIQERAPVEPSAGHSLVWVSRVIVWANVILALGVISPSFFGGFGNATGTTAQIGALLLVLILLPSNLLRFGWFSRRKWVRSLARLRKPLGIGSGVWFVAHSAVALVEYFELDGTLVRQLLIGDMALGVAATLIFVALLITSTESWQRTLGSNWKRLQRLVWFAVPLALAHAILSGLRLNHIEPPGVLLFGIVLIFVVAEFFVLMRRHKARGQSRRGVWAHAGLVVAGMAVAAMIYGASWASIGPWNLTNDAPRERPTALEAAPTNSG